VAYRGRIPLEDIQVDFEVEPLALPGGIGFGVRELVTLKGRLSDPERVRLQRAAQYCPVGQALTKGAMEVEDVVQWDAGEATAFPASAALQRLEGDLPAIPPGSVHGRYLLDTKEYDATGGMVHEGEVKVYVTCENLSRVSRWTCVAGHSSAGWVPPPFPFAQGAWAASTASTLHRLLPPSPEGTPGPVVELAMASRGGRDQAQGNAAAGVVSRRRVVRRVLVPGSPRTTPIEAVHAVLQRDPISLAYRHGGVLLHDEVVIE
jgi:hypothetical protein